MAINTWRPVLTDHWPMETNNSNQNIQPAIQTAPFSNADIYRLQAQWYSDLWNNSLAQAYWDIANNLWAYSNFANTSLNNYDALLNYIRGNEQWLQNVAWKLYNNLAGDIQAQRDYINTMFGPEGQLTKEVNAYYDDLWNYLATDAGRQAAEIAAQWMHSWASLWAIRAQQNQAYNEAFGRYIQAKEQQINAKQQIASNLINYMSTLRQEYWDTTNQYIIDLYRRANDLYNSVAQSAAADLREYNNLRLSRGGGSETPQYYYDINWNLVNSEGEIIKSKEELDKEITNRILFKDSQWTPLYYVTYRDWTTGTLNPKWEAASAQRDTTTKKDWVVA